MNNDDILGLTGRDLDKAVAALMGDYLDSEGWWHSEGGVKISCDDGGPRCYSTDMKAAWSVAEMFQLTVTPKLDATEKSRWLADAKRGNFLDLWRGFGPTAAIAICRAALRLGPKADEPVIRGAMVYADIEADEAWVGKLLDAVESSRSK